VLARSGKLTQLKGSRMQEMIGKHIHVTALSLECRLWVVS
jgi:hypothetical protein